MDRALWVLHWLGFTSWVRRTLRSLRTVKGLLATAWWVLFVVFFFVSCFGLSRMGHVAGGPGTAGPSISIEQVERYGALVLLGLCLLNVVTTTGKGSPIVFLSPEVEFLVAGPFTRRGLLTFKLVQIVLVFAIISAFFLFLPALGSVFHLPSGPWLARYVGVFLMWMFLSLVGMDLASVALLVGTSVYQRWRKAALVVMTVAATAATLYVGWGRPEQNWQETLAQLEQGPVGHALLEVPRCFVRATVVQHYWPDFALWGGICFVIDAALVFLFFKLDAVNIEAAAVAGERVYAQIQQIRRGERLTLGGERSRKVGKSLPALPWWGGVGPVAWRQLQALVRRKRTLVLLVLIPVGIVLLAKFMLIAPGGSISLPILLLSFSVFLPSMFEFDFRKDFDRMDVLKTLPINSLALVVGQALTPFLCSTLIQTFAALGCVLFLSSAEAPQVFGALMSLAIPANVLMVGLDNIAFLLAPSRPIATPGAKLSGIKIVLNVAKFLTIYVAVGIAAALAVGTYYLAGRQLWAAIAVAWLVLAFFAAATLSLAALAFRRFDVAQERPA